MNGAPVNAAVLIMTHQRVNEARANMEIIRSSWQLKDGTASQDIPIVHSVNGPVSVWPKAYLEDLVVRSDGRTSHFQGAAGLIDSGLETIADQFPEARYAICLASDCWIYDTAWLVTLLQEMQSRDHYLAAAPWRIASNTGGVIRGTRHDLLPASGLSTDFFVINLHWAIRSGMIPLRYADFLKQYGLLLNYLQELPFLERYFEGKFLDAIRTWLLLEKGSAKDPWGSAGPKSARRHLRIIDERRIDPSGTYDPPHKGTWESIALCTDEDPRIKRALALKHPQLRGPTLDQLRADDDTSWWCRLPR